jgi:hypothetical protein
MRKVGREVRPFFCEIIKKQEKNPEKYANTYVVVLTKKIKKYYNRVYAGKY